MYSIQLKWKDIVVSGLLMLMAGGACAADWQFAVYASEYEQLSRRNEHVVRCS